MTQRGPWRLLRKPDVSQPTYPTAQGDESGPPGYIGGWISPFTAVALLLFAAVMLVLGIWAAISH